MTPKKVQYFYHMEEYRQGKVPLGVFNLKDISEIKQLNDYSYGNKKYLFMVSVTRWIKKEKPKTKRSYIFSVTSMEDLYSWLISLNFLRFNAYYETFSVIYGKVDLPLYGYNNDKKKKFIFDIESKERTTQFRSRRVNKHKTIKFILKNKNEIDINVKVYDKYLIAKKLIKSCLLNILGAIQQGISKNKENCTNNNQLLLNTLNNLENNPIEDEIKIPQHLSYFVITKKNSFQSSESGDNMTHISQFVSKNKRKNSLGLINEDEEDKKEHTDEEEEENDDNSFNPDKLIPKKYKKKLKFEDSENESEKPSENIISEKKSEKKSEKSKEKSEEDEKSKDKESEDNKIYITDEENDIEDEDNSSDKNHKLKMTNYFINNINCIKNNKLNLEEDDYKSKSQLISSVNDYDDYDYYDIISKDKDLDSEETKIPNYFVKEANINDFINKKNKNIELNKIKIDSKNNYYDY